MTPVYIVRQFETDAQSEATFGAYTDLAEARAEATQAADAWSGTQQETTIRTFIEEWHGGDFVSHRELRRIVTHNPNEQVSREWWIAAAPAFAPIEEHA